MKKHTLSGHLSLVLLAFALTSVVSCTETQPPTDLAASNFIPMPVSVTSTGGAFTFTEKTSIYVQDESLNAIGQFLAGQLTSATGFTPTVEVSAEAPADGHLYLAIAADEALGNEGYSLTIATEGVLLTANQPEGIFRGIQTLRQALPVGNGTGQTAVLATGSVRDYPLYGYRGSMLDVSRHFFGVDDIKRYIDLLAYYKLNTLHLHLSDDQGWRIEIKSWPNLTAQGGKTEVGGGEGGFYTQEQFTEIVNYATERFITIIPEIDMPGHTNAALASYAELNCDGKARDLYTGMEVGFSSFCTDKEITYQFIDDVVGEIAALLPTPYFHLGGDESHSTGLENFIYFIERTREIVRSHGLIDIGWDETAQTALDEKSLIQLWASADFARQAVDKGAKLIMSPATRIYMDMQYDSTTSLGLHWAAYIEVDAAYNWDPATLYEGISNENIVGIEAPLWTETITNMEEIEYMVFPRLPGYAEIGWSPADKRNWEEYKARLAAHSPRMDALDINYYPSPLVTWPGK